MHVSPLNGSAEADLDKAEALPARTVLAGGNYVVERAIGRGGFGITYLARDLSLDRAVVIKECFPELICVRSGLNVVATRRETAAQFSKCIEMFMREARSIARLMHPNIIKVHAVFEQNTTAYMVLDLVEGDDLLTIADDPDRRLSPAEIKDIALQVLDALSVVHDHNLLHRDISPDNILLDKHGKPVLIDFGSAKELASDRGRAKTAFLFIKDGYSPFEFYVRGAAHSPASDLYALGGTLYHLITGDPPPDSQTRQSENIGGRPDPYVPLVGRFDDYEPIFLAAIDMALSLPIHERFQYAADWYDVITQEPAEEPASSGSSAGSPQSVLGALIADTNRDVLGGTKGRAAALVLGSDQQSGTLRPAWRDEFNQETQEIAARQAAGLDDDEAEPGDFAADQGPAERIRSSLSTTIPGMPDPDEQEREKELIALYFKNKNKHKRKRAARQQVKRALLYFTLSASAIALIAYVAVNYERMQEDGTWEVLFSSEGLCANETLRAISPVTVNCDGRGEARRLDLNDRSRILDMNQTNRFGLN
jgi:serine/threonine protein kinase